MKKNKKGSKKNSIISVVQSPDEGAKKTENLNECVTENESGNPEEHGIISIVQSPDVETDKQQ